jgi:hypothetical protein
LKYTRRQLMTSSPALLLSELLQHPLPTLPPPTDDQLAERLLVVEGEVRAEKVLREWANWHILRRLERIEKQVRTPGPHPENFRKPT